MSEEYEYDAILLTFLFSLHKNYLRIIDFCSYVPLICFRGVRFMSLFFSCLSKNNLSALCFFFLSLMSSSNQDNHHCCSNHHKYHNNNHNYNHNYHPCNQHSHHNSHHSKNYHLSYYPTKDHRQAPYDIDTSSDLQKQQEYSATCDTSRHKHRNNQAEQQQQSGVHTNTLTGTSGPRQHSKRDQC